MESDCNTLSFYGYFAENMESLGLTAPKSLFETRDKALQTIGQLVAAIKVASPGATIGELFGALWFSEQLVVVSGLGAAYYVGEAIGSLAVATGRYISCGATIAGSIWDLTHGMESEPSVAQVLRTHPEVYRANMPPSFRRAYALHARAPLGAR